jgi:hypothetical protein
MVEQLHRQVGWHLAAESLRPNRNTEVLSGSVCPAGSSSRDRPRPPGASSSRYLPEPVSSELGMRTGLKSDWPRR